MGPTFPQPSDIRQNAQQQTSAAADGISLQPAVNVHIPGNHPNKEQHGVQNQGNSTQQPGSTCSSMTAALTTAAAIAAVSKSIPSTEVKGTTQVSSTILNQSGRNAAAPPAQESANSTNPAPRPLLVHPQVGVTETPAVFRNVKLRRGKWTPEEEQYADFLISEFEKGTVDDCENGATLRAFLSKKLHCAPMRISKKYAGKSIGKHVFLARQAMDGNILARNRARRQDLEMGFYKSLLQEDHPASASIRAAMLPHFVAPGGGAQQQVHTPLIQHISVNASSYFPHQVGGSQPTQFITYVPSTASHSHVASTPVVSVANTTASQPNAAAPTAQPPALVQLRQTYMSVVNQAPGPTPILQQTAISSDQKQDKPQQSNPEASALLAQLHQNAAAQKSVQPLNAAQPAPGPSDVPLQDGHARGTMDIPDFLSGFEEVAARSNAAAPQQEQPHSMRKFDLTKKFPIQPLRTANSGRSENTTPAQDVHSTPPFTSRSFDDMHKFLGKGLSPSTFDLDETAAASSTSSTVPAPQKVHSVQHAGSSIFDGSSNPAVGSALPPVPLSLQPKSVCADTYAVFAQESARAVSQHSAYCRTGQRNEQTHDTLLPQINLPAVIPDDSTTRRALADPPCLPGNNASPVDGAALTESTHTQSGVGSHLNRTSGQSMVAQSSSVEMSIANLMAHSQATSGQDRCEGTINSGSGGADRTSLASHGFRQLDDIVVAHNPVVVSGSENASENADSEDSNSEGGVISRAAKKPRISPSLLSSSLSSAGGDSNRS